jgi:probable HAF family extracellular repeat protein
MNLVSKLCIRARVPRRPGSYRPRLLVERLEERCLLSYQITDLGTSFPNGINNSGQVVGGLYTSYTIHAFLWDVDNGMQDLGTLGGIASSANGVNNSGQVVGSSSTPSGDPHAFLWDATNGMQDLGTLPGDYSSEANGINDSGQVVGTSFTGSGPYHAFLWDASNGMQDLGTLGGTVSYASGINDSGQVVGYSTTSGALHAFLWDAANGMQDLGTLPGDYSSEANGINDSGQVAGQSYVPGESGPFHAFLWDATNGMQDLGALPGSVGSSASSINDSGQVVGGSGFYDPITEGYYSRAFLWQNGTITDLTSLLPPDTGWTLSGSNAINNAGQIVGAGRQYDYPTHGYLLSPDSSAVPAPASAVAGTPFAVTVTALDASGSSRLTTLDMGIVSRPLFPVLTSISIAPAEMTPTDSAPSFAPPETVDPLVGKQSATNAVSALLSEGMPFDVTVTAVDPFGNVDTNYQGTVTFSTSDADPSVVLPADYIFTAADAGVHTFTNSSLGETTLITPGDQSITATDTASGINGSATVTVTLGPLDLSVPALARDRHSQQPFDLFGSPALDG